MDGVDVNAQEYEPGRYDMEFEGSWSLLGRLRENVTDDPARGREWAIAATMAEQLHAWITYIIAQVDDND